MLRSLAICTTIAGAIVGAARAQNVPSGFVVDTLVSSGLQAPHDLCFLPDGRMLIANRGGLVQVYAGSGVVTVGTVPSVETGSERGLLSVEADPNFPSNGYIYVWYSSTADAFLHLDRFTCTGDLSNPTSTNLTFASASRRVILAAMPDNAFNHNGGSARFGPDGMLYLCVGDDASACSAQSTNSSAGCLLRMDVSGLGSGASTTAPSFSALDPGTNPLSANTDISQLVIAHGLRNPYRMEIDQLTGSLYIGDVGQNAVEEYSEYVYPATGPLPLVNFGWPWREGNNAYSSCSGTLPPGLVAPIAAVSQSAGWGSVMGGPRYRNQNGPFDFGAAYEGDAFYLDYFAGQVRRLTLSGTWGPAAAVPGQPTTADWANGFVAVTALRQGPDGALYFSQHTGTYGTSGGSIKRVRPQGPTNSVVAVSGGGQVVPATEPFPHPIEVRVLDPQNQPLPNGVVNFSISGPGVLGTTNPVIADGNGLASTTVTASNSGGPITVTASTPNSTTPATVSLYARNISVAGTSTLVVLSITNTTAAVPAQVPYIVMVSLPGAPVWNSPIGPICTDPASPLTIVIEDGTGIFGGVSLSGTGGIGTPTLTKIYNLAPGLLNGLLLRFQAVGIDPVAGIFRTDCESRQF